MYIICVCSVSIHRLEGRHHRVVASVFGLLQVSEAACTVSEICSSEELLMQVTVFRIGFAALAGVAALGTPVPRCIRSGLGMGRNINRTDGSILH